MWDRDTALTNIVFEQLLATETLMYLTWFDNNSWLIELADQRILLDPWLVDSLVFAQQSWLFEGIRQQPTPIPEADLLLLSQGLEDHAHPPTLTQIRRDIPVVASHNGAKVVQGLGYTQVTTLDHGQTHDFNGVQIQALPGAPIGPLLKENAYLIKAEGLTLYYEPHGYADPQLKQLGPIDVVITPMADQTLPLVGPIVRRQGAQLLADWVTPQVMLPTANAATTDYRGFLTQLLSTKGSATEFQSALAPESPIQVLQPRPGERIALPVAVH